jgi:hypothetical protein
MKLRSMESSLDLVLDSFEVERDGYPDVTVHALAVAATLQECWEFEGSQMFLFRKSIPTCFALPGERARLLSLSRVYSPSGGSGFPCFPDVLDRPLPESDTRPGMQVIPDVGMRLDCIVHGVKLHSVKVLARMGAIVAMSARRCVTSAAVPGEYLPGWKICALSIPV